MSSKTASGRPKKQNKKTKSGARQNQSITPIRPADHKTDKFLQEIAANHSLGQYAEARQKCEHALLDDPDNILLRKALGVTMLYQGENQSAEAILADVVDLLPADSDALNSLGVAQDAQIRLVQAEACFRRALAINPKEAGALSNLARTLVHQGLVEDGIAQYRQLVKLQPDDPKSRQQLLGALHYSSKCTAADIHGELLEWGRLSERLVPNGKNHARHHTDRTLERPLRVGLVSGDFRMHPVGALTVAGLEAVNRERIELVAYADESAFRRDKNDPIEQRLRNTLTIWRQITGLDEATVAKMIVDDQIDILIDLTDHLAGGWLKVFALRPAPILVKWVGGQINTTGSGFFDYFLSDSVETPLKDDPWYVEQVVRMPDGYVCFAPPPWAPAVGTLPALQNRHITFGCFNNTAKINADLVALWSTLLQRLPGSRLILQYKGFGDPQVAERYHQLFSKYGISHERVDIRGPTQHWKLLNTYNEVDISLDPFPYSGGLTTCESLWMGVPVVTLPGPTFAGRHSATHLCNAGLGDWVVDSPDAYVDLAVRWANDIYGLARLRHGLRQQVAQSPLVDGPRFARHLENALGEMWRRWCEGETERRSIEVAQVAQVANSAPENSIAALPLPENDPALDALLLQALEKHEAGDAHNALVICQQIIASNPAFSQAFHLSGLITAELGRLDMAENMLRRAIALAPLAVEYYNSLGFVLFRQNRLDEAATLFKEALHLRPDYDDAMANLAELERQQPTAGLHRVSGNEHSVEAEASQTQKQPLLKPAAQASKLDDELEKACDLAEKLIEVNDLAQAGQLCLSVLQARSGHARALFLSALLNQRTGDTHNARLRVEQAIDLEPQHAPWWQLFAEVLRAQGKEDEADRAQEQAQGIQIVDFARSLIKTSQDDLATVITNCEEALVADPDDNTAFFVLTFALLAKACGGVDRSAPMQRELELRLGTLGWQHKQSLYSYWLKDAEVRTERTNPRITAVVVASQFKPETIENLAELRRQGEDQIQIIFVNNGCSNQVLKPLASYADVWLNTLGNAGAYLAKNLGALYATAPVLLFVDDDGLPGPGFIQGHLDAHARWAPVSLRGACRSHAAADDPPHFRPSNTAFPCPPTLESNTSFPLQAFAQVGGWGDYLLFGYGGLDISHRLLELGFDPRRQVYDPVPLLVQETNRGPQHALDESRKQSTSLIMLRAMHQTLLKSQARMQEAKHSSLASSSTGPNVVREGLECLARGFNIDGDLQDIIQKGRRATTYKIQIKGEPHVLKVFSDTVDGRQSLQAEIKAMHEFAGRVWAPFWVNSGENWILQRFYPAKNRLDVVAARLSNVEKKKIAGKVLDIIYDLYQSGYAHRDIHGKNIFFHEGELILIDFETLCDQSHDVPFLASYDITGQGLSSPYKTGNMCFLQDNTTYCLKFVLNTNLKSALQYSQHKSSFSPKNKKNAAATLRNRLKIASSTFRTGNNRHKIRSQGAIYCSFKTANLVVSRAESQRDSSIRIGQFGLTENDLMGKTVIDLGSNNGAMLFELSNYNIASGTGFEYDQDKVALARDIAEFSNLSQLQFEQADIDKLQAETIGVADIVLCLAIEKHLKQPEALYPLLGKITKHKLLFEGNANCDPEEVVKRLRLAGFSRVDYLGYCTDDILSANNVRPVFVAVKPTQATHKNPYSSLSSKHFWKTSVSSIEPTAINHWYNKKFEVNENVIITAGSCFAQHIGKSLVANGFNYLDVEPAPQFLKPDSRPEFGYEMYSARYGNIYNPRQLLQLVQRALGIFEPKESFWLKGNGVVDPFRPTIEPQPFVNIEELLEQRDWHLKAVKEMFSKADIFVFTMGLTESWLSNEDGAIFPIAPGIAGGNHDTSKYSFKNFSYSEILADLEQVITLTRRINKNIKFILTVSPVPLMATATNNHVVVASSYSKSVLRAAAGYLSDHYDFIDYFPSFEIISSHPMRGHFYNADKRTVSPEGVKHVMSQFFAEHTPPNGLISNKKMAIAPDSNDPVCDEELLDGFGVSP